MPGRLSGLVGLCGTARTLSRPAVKSLAPPCKDWRSQGAPMQRQGCGGLEWSCQSAAPRLRHLRMVSVDTPSRRTRTPVGSNERAISEIERQSFRHVCRPPRGRQLESASLTDLEITPESQLGCCANEALQKGPVLRIRSEDEY